MALLLALTSPTLCPHFLPKNKKRPKIPLNFFFFPVQTSSFLLYIFPHTLAFLLLGFLTISTRSNEPSEYSLCSFQHLNPRQPLRLPTNHCILRLVVLFRARVVNPPSKQSPDLLHTAFNHVKPTFRHVYLCATVLLV